MIVDRNKTKKDLEHNLVGMRQGERRLLVLKASALPGAFYTPAGVGHEQQSASAILASDPSAVVFFDVHLLRVSPMPTNRTCVCVFSIV